jgi:hypothetical protein
MKRAIHRFEINFRNFQVARDTLQPSGQHLVVKDRWKIRLAALVKQFVLIT